LPAAAARVSPTSRSRSRMLQWRGATKTAADRRFGSAGVTFNQRNNPVHFHCDLTTGVRSRYAKYFVNDELETCVSMSTEFPSKNGIARKWHVIDAENVVLGKLASKAAMLLMGKTKPSYTPFLDTGDHVIVINADKVKLTGRKEDSKVYRHFTGYPGGLVETTFKRVRETRPTRIVEEAIQGMLPKTKLGKQMYRKLKVYAGDRHPHAAQKPAALAVK
jgi:large subunit ribosomal protein L13